MNDKQTNKKNNPPVQAEQSNWDYIPINPEIIQNEVSSMNPQNILETLNVMKIIEAKNHNSKTTDYSFLGYEITVDGEYIGHNAKRYSTLEFLKFIQETQFSGIPFQEVLKKVIVAWDNHSF